MASRLKRHRTRPEIGADRVGQGAQQSPKNRAYVEALTWLNVRWMERLGDKLSRVEKVRLRATRDPEKRERLRAALLQRQQNRMPKQQRDEAYAKIVLEMPCRLRRSLGDRSHGERSLMVVPHESAKRDRDFHAAVRRGDPSARFEFVRRALGARGVSR